MVAPALDAWKRTAAQKAIAAIPGLGDLAEGTAQVLLGSAVLVKNSLGMFVGILLAVLLVVPLLKIAAYGVAVSYTHLDVYKRHIKMYGENAFANPSYGRIVNRKHFDRISGLIEENKVVYGGRTKEETLQIEPTILFPVSEKDAVMQEEIFGPVLPILVVENMDEAQRFVQNREKPLACYIFTSSRKTRRKFVCYTSFGGGLSLIHI